MLLGFDPEIAEFVAGSTLGVVLLLIGLSVGLWLGRWAERQRGGRVNHEANRAVEMFGTLSQYMTQVSSMVADHRHSVDLWDERVRLARLREEDDPELEEIAAANQALRERLTLAETALKNQACAVANYVAEARTDALTGLPNRRALDETLADCWTRWRRDEAPFSVVLIDVDHFKSFNDRFGHLAGDSVLAQVARALHEANEPDWTLARFGGEEFAIVVARDNPDAGRRAARLARQAIEQGNFLIDGTRHALTVSCGIAEVRPHERLTDLLARADAAMYASKQAGRNCAHWHDGSRPRVLDIGMAEIDRPTRKTVLRV